MIYICIPTYNEQQTVGVVLWKLRQVLTEFRRDYQLLVADDASTDKTPEVLEPYTRVLPLTVIRCTRRQGYAASLEMLLREAIRRSEYPKRDVIVAMQADFSDEPDDVVALIKRLEAGADVAVGNKVSTTKEPRRRRLARMLSHFFTRRHAWPEGVVTPFDGYRAYRLYAVKRAMEDREGQRLIRYDGWASQAELLRAVLPHARRVDVVDVEDRTDRLQRPRRERPFASALQVRGMARNTEPAGLIGVADLDQTAATASRSRERATASSNGGDNGRQASKRNGERRDRRPEPARTRAPAAEDRSPGRGQRDPEAAPRQGQRGSEAGPRQGQRPPRGADAEPRRKPEGGAPRGESRSPQAERERRPRGPRSEAGADSRAPRGSAVVPPEPGADQLAGSTPPNGLPEGGVTAEAADLASPAGLIGGTGMAGQGDANGPMGPGDAAEGSAAAPARSGRPKRKRRRRNRGGGTAATGSPADEAAADDQDAAGGEAEELNGEAGSLEAAGSESAAGGPRKRRRRGGRRGGRGRRPRPDGAEGAEGVEPAGAAEGQVAQLHPVSADPGLPPAEVE